VARYAEGTTVTVERSRGEITGILASHGVVEMGWRTGPAEDRLMFKLGGRSYLFAIPKPTAQDLWNQWKADGKRQRGLKDPPNDAPGGAEWRRRWRANVLLLKAKLEFADGETSTVERELMPYMLTAGGKTLGDLIESPEGARLLLGGGR